MLMSEVLSQIVPVEGTRNLTIRQKIRGVEVEEILETTNQDEYQRPEKAPVGKVWLGLR
jgi:hypothetical protein